MKKRLDRVTLKALKSFDNERGCQLQQNFSRQQLPSDKTENRAYLFVSRFSLFIYTFNSRSSSSGFLVQLMTPQPFFHFLWVVARSRPLRDLCRRVARRKPVSIASPYWPWMEGKWGKNSVQSHYCTVTHMNHMSMFSFIQWCIHLIIYFPNTVSQLVNFLLTELLLAKRWKLCL